MRQYTPSPDPRIISASIPPAPPRMPGSHQGNPGRSYPRTDCDQKTKASNLGRGGGRPKRQSRAGLSSVSLLRVLTLTVMGSGEELSKPEVSEAAASAAPSRKQESCDTAQSSAAAQDSAPREAPPSSEGAGGAQGAAGETGADAAAKPEAAQAQRSTGKRPREDEDESVPNTWALPTDDPAHRAFLDAELAAARAKIGALLQAHSSMASQQQAASRASSGGDTATVSSSPDHSDSPQPVATPSSPVSADGSATLLTWNDEIDDGFLRAHAEVGMPLGPKKGDTIAVYRMHLPRCIDAKIYGRWGFWKAHLPTQACADAADYERLRARRDIQASPRHLLRTNTKKQKKEEPGNGAFSAEEDETYLKLLQIHGKPNKANQAAMVAFASAFADRTESSWKAHQNAFVQDSGGTWRYG